MDHSLTKIELLYRLLSHVEKRHTLKQFLIFVTHHEFFDYLDSKCSQCGKIYNGKHTDSNCARMLDWIEQNRMSNLEIHKILSEMIKVPVTSSPVSEPMRKRHRRSRKRSQLKNLSDGDQSDFGDFSESKHDQSNQLFWLDFQKPFNFGNTLYHRCPAIDCNFRTLKKCDDDDDNREIMVHLREKHPIEFIVLKQTKFPKSNVQCAQCNFWFRSGGFSKSTFVLSHLANFILDGESLLGRDGLCLLITARACYLTI